MSACSALWLAAGSPSAWEQLKRVPKDTWINLLVVVVALFLIVRMWRALKKINDYAPYVVATLTFGSIFFYWVYARTEPRFLTPIVEQLAPFFPSKARQDQIQEGRRKGREV